MTVSKTSPLTGWLKRPPWGPYNPAWGELLSAESQLDASQFSVNQRCHSNKPCALCLLSTATGIAVDHCFVIPMGLTFGLTFSVLAMFWLLYWAKSKTMLHVRSILLVSTAILMGANWHHQYWNGYPANEIGYFAAETPAPAVIRGMVLELPKLIPARLSGLMDRTVIGERSRLVIRISGIRSRGKWIATSGLVQVTIDGKVSELFAGSEIETGGFLSKPARSRSQADLDLRKYYRSRRVNAVIFVNHSDAIRKLAKDSKGFSFYRELDSVRVVCQRSISRDLSSKSSQLLSAMLLGERHLVSSEDREKFLVTGTMHLLAISGLHVGILCLGFVVLVKLGVVSQKFGFSLMLVFVVFYCLLTGIRIPVLRATILVVIYGLAKLFRKNPFSVNSLSLAGLVVIVVNPVALFLPGAQLSFVAVATLVMIGERVQKQQQNRDSLDRFLYRKRPAFVRIKDFSVQYVWLCLLSSFAIWIATIPLVNQYFHVVSLSGILVNVVLMIPVSILLNLGFLMMVFDLVGCTTSIAVVVEYFVNVVEVVIDIAAGIPFTHWWTYPVDPPLLSVFYLVFWAFFFIGRFRLPQRWQLTLVLIWLTGTLTIPGIKSHFCQKQLAVTFVDVGHGTGVLIEFPNGANVLYDAGSLNSSRQAVDRISAVLWEKQVYVLDAVMISHADLDHYNAVPKLTSRFRIKRLLVSPHMLDGDQGEAWQHLLRFMQGKCIPVLPVDSRSRMRFDSQCETIVIHPTRDFEGGSDNANSLVLGICFLGRKILLSGDLESVDALKNRPLNCAIMMAPHHGSSSSDHLAFGRWATPRYVVISCAREKLDPGIIRDYQSVGAKVYPTSRFAAVSFTIGPQGIKIDSFLE